MDTALDLIEKYGGKLLLIHYDVEKSVIPLDDFIISAESTRSIIADLNKNLFDGKLKYEIVVVPPEDGSFLRILGIIMLSGSFLLSATAGDIISGVLKDRTGKGTEELSQQLSHKTFQKLEAVETRFNKKELEEIISDLTTTFIATEEEKLRKHGLTKEKFREAYQARNELYEAFYRNDDIKGVGFDSSEKFPIQRNDFARFIINIPEEEIEDDEPDWKVEITHVKVLSPYWERGSKREWKGKSNQVKEASFTIEDEEFWHRVDNEWLSVKVKDVMKVQWIFTLENGKRKNIKVLRVIQFNSEDISEPLNDEELTFALKRYSKMPLAKQPDMFDE